MSEKSSQDGDSLQQLQGSVDKLKKIERLEGIVNKIIFDEELGEEEVEVFSVFTEDEHAEDILKQVVEDLDCNIAFKNRYIEELEAKIQKMGRAIRGYLEANQEADTVSEVCSDQEKENWNQVQCLLDVPMRSSKGSMDSP